MDIQDYGHTYRAVMGWSGEATTVSRTQTHTHTHIKIERGRERDIRTYKEAQSASTCHDVHGTEPSLILAAVLHGAYWLPVVCKE